MATHRVYIGSLLTPDASGNVFWQPSSILDTNDLLPTVQVLIFKDTATKDKSSCVFAVPKNFIGTAKFGVVWKTTATSGNVVWNFDYRATADAESLDQATFQESLAVTDAAKGTTNQMNDANVAATSANFAVDDLVLLTVARDGTSGSDTMAASAQLYEVYFEYADA